MKEYILAIGDKNIIIKPDEFAEQANGSIMIRCGDTMVLSTVTMSGQKKEDLDFLPLTIDYEEKSYAAGKIIGSRYNKREGRPSDVAIITSRLIDRCLRPLFPEELKGKEIQIIATCLSWDATNDADVLGLISSSTALMISDIPFQGPVGAVRVGRNDGKFILNPTYEERKKSDIDIIFAGVKDKNGKVLLNMIEGEFNETNEKSVFEAFTLAEKSINELCNLQEIIAKEAGKNKSEIIPKQENIKLKKELREIFEKEIREALEKKDKSERLVKMDQVEKKLNEFLNEEYPNDEIKRKSLPSFIDEETGRIIKENILVRDQRPDGRKSDELRVLDLRVGILPRTHGSALFARGQTKSLSILTLGSPGDQQLLEDMEETKEKRFMHHYNFPPYSVGEIKSMRGPSRRDIGHGLLVEKAIAPILPSFDDFPYTIRIVSEILSSNGSTSMASACSASLALMDAGVGIKRPVAGISIGIIQDEETGQHKLLTDIQGLEDHHGGMDLKIAGTSEGLTAIQMDVKIKGITGQVFSEALEQAKKTRYEILEKMKIVLDGPRKELSPYAPRVITFQINPEKIREVIGPGGKMINEIIDKTGATIDIKDSGLVFVTSTKEEAAWRAVTWIKNIIREVEIGEVFQGRVKRILDFGAFVEILPNQEGMVHISKLANHHVNKVGDVVKVGETIPVKVIGIDDQGRINLSLKDAPKDFLV